MQEKSRSFSPKDAEALANSPQGKQLLQQIQQYDSAALRTAAEKARQGDMDSVKQALSPLLSDPKIQALLKNLGGKP